MSDHLFTRYGKRYGLLDVLDALAAICVHNDKGDIFFVSSALNPDSFTVHVFLNGTVPTTLIDHLKKKFRVNSKYSKTSFYSTNDVYN